MKSGKSNQRSNFFIPIISNFLKIETHKKKFSLTYTNPDTAEVFDQNTNQLVDEMYLPTLMSSHREIYPDIIQRQIYENLDIENVIF